MPRFRNYWIYSAGLVLAWVVVFVLVALSRGQDGVGAVLPVFFGFCIGWVSATIARYVYPPPRQRAAK